MIIYNNNLIVSKYIRIGKFKILKTKLSKVFEIFFLRNLYYWVKMVKKNISISFFVKYYLSRFFFFKYFLIYWIINRILYYILFNKSSFEWFLGIYLFKFKFIFLLLLYFFKKISFMFFEWLNIIKKKKNYLNNFWEKNFFFFWNMFFLTRIKHIYYNICDLDNYKNVFLKNNFCKEFYLDIISDFSIKLFYKKNYNKYDYIFFYFNNKSFKVNMVFSTFYYYYLLLNNNLFLIQYVFLKNHIILIFNKFFKFFNLNLAMKLSFFLKKIDKKEICNRNNYTYNFFFSKYKNFLLSYLDDKFINKKNIFFFWKYYKKYFNIKNNQFLKIKINKIFFDNSYVNYLNYKLLFNLSQKKIYNNNINLNILNDIENNSIKSMFFFENKNMKINKKKNIYKIIF